MRVDDQLGSPDRDRLAAVNRHRVREGAGRPDRLGCRYPRGHGQKRRPRRLPRHQILRGLDVLDPVPP